MDIPFQYHFEWDPAKAQSNIKKHGIDFERAATVFLDAQGLSQFDAGHSSKNEDRWLTLGMDRTGTLLVVSHTYVEEKEKNARVRIISVRKATKNEAISYTGGN